MKRDPVSAERLMAALRKTRSVVGGNVAAVSSAWPAGTVKYKDGRMARVFVKVIRFCPKALEASPETGGLSVEI